MVWKNPVTLAHTGMQVWPMLFKLLPPPWHAPIPKTCMGMQLPVRLIPKVMEKLYLHGKKRAYKPNLRWCSVEPVHDCTYEEQGPPCHDMSKPAHIDVPCPFALFAQPHPLSPPPFPVTATNDHCANWPCILLRQLPLPVNVGSSEPSCTCSSRGKQARGEVPVHQLLWAAQAEAQGQAHGWLVT